MFHLKIEGKPIHNGFNFYPLNDDVSFGVVIRYGKKIPNTKLGSKLFFFRYAKHIKKLIITNMNYK